MICTPTCREAESAGRFANSQGRMISVRLVQETDAVIRRVESVQHAKAGYCHEITRPLPMVDAATKLAMRGINGERPRWSRLLAFCAEGGWKGDVFHRVPPLDSLRVLGLPDLGLGKRRRESVRVISGVVGLMECTRLYRHSQ